MTDQLRFSPVRVLDTNGDPVAGAKAYFYESGTTDPIVVYADQVGTAHPVPLVADAQGVFPMVFRVSTNPIKVLVTDASDAAVNGFPIDPVPFSTTGNSGAESIPFAPIPNNGGLTVAEAIANNTDAIASLPSSARQITAGTGLTGGGDLSADITFNADIASAAAITAGTANKLVDASGLRAEIDAAVTAAKIAEIGAWDHSADVTEIVFADLSDWDSIQIDGVISMTDTFAARIEVSDDNGATWRSTGYDSTASEVNAVVRVTDGFNLTTVAYNGFISISSRIANLNDSTRKTQISAQLEASASARVYNSSGRYDANEAHNAIRLTGTTFNGGNIRIVGLMK